MTDPARASSINPSTPLGVPTTWPVIRLYKASKKYNEDPEVKARKHRLKKVGQRGPSYTPIKSHALARHYVNQGANLGLLTGQASGIIILDCDNRAALDELMQVFGPLPIAVESGRGEGRVHIYGKWFPGARTTRLKWKDAEFGHLLSDGSHAVMPESIHPDTGRRYRWAPGFDPLRTPIPDFSDALKAFLISQGAPTADRAAPRPEPQALPASEYERRKALALEEFDGKERHASGNIKFRCPGCAEDDKHNDNAVLFPTGTVACWKKIPSHNAELRKRFGIPAGARADADPWVQAQITQWLVDHMQDPAFTATLSSTTIAMLHAHAAIVYRLGRLDYPGAEREIAELAGVHHVTVRHNNPKLIRSGIVSRTFRGRRGPKHKPTRWHFNLPPSYRLQDPDAQVTSRTQLVPGKGVKQEELLEKTGYAMLPAVDWPLILAHDVFRNRTGLGKGCGRVYLHLLLAGPAGITIMLFGPTKKMTVSRQLDRLKGHRLAQVDRQLHRWTVGPALLEHVVQALGSNGRLELQKEEHAADRAAWYPDPKHPLVRLPRVAGPRRPRRPKSPPPPALQSVLDYVRAHRPPRRRRRS